MKAHRPYVPEQSYLLPPSPREWLPKGHLAFLDGEGLHVMLPCGLARDSCTGADSCPTA